MRNKEDNEQKEEDKVSQYVRKGDTEEVEQRHAAGIQHKGGGRKMMKHTGKLQISEQNSNEEEKSKIKGAERERQ